MSKFCPQFAKDPLPPATQGQPYSAQLWTAGALEQVTAVPAGLSVSASRMLTGTPTQAGTFTVTVSVKAGSPCPLGDMAVLESSWSLTVRDTQPPTIGAFTVAPDTLPSNGGDVTVTVQASDNLGVARVVSSRILPDGTGSSGMLQLKSGSAQNGTWTMTWSLPSNSSSAAVAYVIKAWTLDAANNETRAAAARTVIVGRHLSGQELLRLKPTTP
jgi:hypothetical protein